MTMKLFLSTLALLLTCGCSAVTSKRPVGEKPARIVAENWQGKWISRDGTVNIKVDDAERGLLTVTWNERNDPKPSTVRIQLLESNGWVFANTNEWNDDPQPEYVWARIRNEGGQITIWAPDLKAFKRLVTSGVIPGKVRNNDVVLDELKPIHLQQIISGSRGLLFDWEDPAALVRVRE